MSRKLLTALVALLFIGLPEAHTQKMFKKANKQFELKAYNLAITNYHKTLGEEDGSNIEAMMYLAESYRLTNRPIQANQWYAKSLGLLDQYPEIKLNYAHTLKQMGKYDQAQELYWQFKEHDPILGEHYALSCDFAKEVLGAEDSYDIRLFGGNSKYADFGVSFYNGKVVFSSFRKSLDGIVGDRNDGHIKKNKNHLIYSVADNPSMRDPLHQLRDALKEDDNLGPVSYATDLTRCAYTKNNFKDGFDFIGLNDHDMSIYLGEVNEDGDFTDETPFKYNEIGYASGFPCLAFGGTALYYASNKPGGYGGYDLYVSYHKNGEWTYPENLGGQINSSGNEITPFFDGEKLYFSSDYHQGIGGMDVFYTKVVDGAWSFAQNMGKGVNSLSDDYFFTINPSTKDYYITSNRLGGRGKDDIYIATPLPTMEYAAATEVPSVVNLNDLIKDTGTSNSDMSSVAVMEDAAVEVKTLNIPATFQLPVEGDNVDVQKEIVAVPEGAFAPTEMVTGNEEGPERITLFEDESSTEILEDAELEEEVITSTEVIGTSAYTFGSNDAVTLESARLVAFNEVLDFESNVYFIQVAAIFQNRVNMTQFKNLAAHGNLYKVSKSNSVKVRLGYYNTREEAASVLQKVKSMGYVDAFIAHEPLAIHEIQLAVPSEQESDPYASNYKVRLASYEDPRFFDVNSVSDIGKVEQWTKSGWTIFVLSGFRTLEDAEKARVKAINKGYTSAELVIDNDGILERLVRN